MGLSEYGPKQKRHDVENASRLTYGNQRVMMVLIQLQSVWKIGINQVCEYNIQIK